MQNTQMRRREFTLGIAGSLVLAGKALAATRELPEFTFHVVTDTHCGRGDSLTAARQWSQAVTAIEGLSGQFVLHLGDVVDGGREAQYPIYLESRAKLKRPVHEVPGNHDPPELFSKHIRAQIDMSFVHGGVRFVLFNNSVTTSHLGFVKPEQIAWLKSELTAAAKADELVVLACHVPVHTNGPPDRGWYVKPADGQTDLYAALDEHRGRVLAMLHGHFHNGIRGWEDHRPYAEVLFPSCCYNQDRGLVDELRPGFTQVTLGRGKMKLEYKLLKEECNASHECAVGS